MSAPASSSARSGSAPKRWSALGALGTLGVLGGMIWGGCTVGSPDGDPESDPATGQAQQAIGGCTGGYDAQGNALGTVAPGTAVCGSGFRVWYCDASSNWNYEGNMCSNVGAAPPVPSVYCTGGYDAAGNNLGFVAAGTVVCGTGHLTYLCNASGSWVYQGASCNVASCTNRILDPGEVQEDCGGSCLCAGGQGCRTGANCASGTCTNSVCSGALLSFNTCSQTGATGPSQAQCDSAYTSTTLAGQVTLSAGVQLWTVPQTGTYRMEAWGAGAGNTPSQAGARMRGDFALTEGTQLKIIVGQNASTIDAGSGGTFVSLSDNTPLLVAGGSGGLGGLTLLDSSLLSGTTSQLATNAACGSSNTVPGQGGACNGCCGEGAAGFNGDGTLFTGTAAAAFINGGVGATASGTVGGFGGGAVNACQGIPSRSGGGGGYSGGNAGCTTPALTWGTGGGSFNSGTNQSNSSGVRNGQGLLTIQWIGG